MISGISSQSSYSTTSLSEMRQKMFKKIDSDGDGKITKDELSALFSNNQKSSGVSGTSTKSTDSTNSIDELFSAIDTDSDGSISEDENNSYMEQMEKQFNPFSMGSGMPPANMMMNMLKNNSMDSSDTQESGSLADIQKKVFSAIDTDGDSKVTKDELNTYISSMEQESTSTVTSSDSDTSSKIDELFSSIDANQDGSISEDENNSYMEKLDSNKKANRPGNGMPPPPPPMEDESQTTSTTSAKSTSSASSVNSTDSTTDAFDWEELLKFSSTKNSDLLNSIFNLAS